MTDSPRRAGRLPETLATWIYLLHESGRLAEDADIRAACAALHAAGVELDDHAADVGVAGEALLSAVIHALEATGPDPAASALPLLRRLYGADRIATDFAPTREARVQAARAHQFQTNLPWLARIIDRFPDGSVGPHWVLVERVTDRVSCMDPYPWDDLDEEYETPLVDFLVKWELAGCDGVRWAH